MKFKIQTTNLNLTLQNKETNLFRVLFSFNQTLLTNAKKYISTKSFNQVDDLSDVGNVTLCCNDKPSLIISLGSKDKFNLNKYHSALSSLATWLRQNKKISTLDLILEEELANLLYPNKGAYVEQTIFHLLNNMYYFDQFKSSRKTLSINSINFVIKAPNKNHLDSAVALLNGMYLVKDLGNTPANVATPTYLAKTATTMAKLSKKVNVKILNKKELKDLGMNCFLAVSLGSEEEPKFIVLNYTGAKNSKEKPIVLIGKGITFDSGGISIKPKVGMEELKYDMLGAATVLGIFRSVVELNLPINLVVTAPCAENMISGKAIKPGDIVTTMSGKTVEITNTDAEGRLVLCDALTYVEKFNPKLVIDMATLTGACITALGYAASALYSNNEQLCMALKQAASKTDDKVWEMPLFDEYETGLKSTIADLVNIGGWSGIAGSSVAAKFLSKFVNYPWAHLDIAGSSITRGSYDGTHAHGGASGRPFNLLMNFIRNYK